MKIPKSFRWQPTGKTLGAGGQAQVQEVEDSLGEYSGTYALKALGKEKPPQAYERFYREITAIKVLKHPYVVRVVDSSSPSDEFQYYVMEFVDGARPLQSILGSSSNPFFSNPVAAIDLFEKLAQAILACERSDPKIVHRDLSPSNVLLVPDGSIRVIDFGICQIEGDSTVTLADEGVGTINYMAPECESGAAGNIGTHSDLYSAGKILWSAVTSQRAFAREKPAFTTKSMAKIFPENPDTFHLYHIFARTIRHDPSTRWHSAQDAISECSAVRRLILHGYPPLEQIFDYCPICGIGTLKDFSGSHMVFGNPNPSGIYAKQCDYCGMCMAINGNRFRENMKERESLE
ncbi:MAG TPA: serine/threonine-protein kinase [Syntrophorhabdaceae bacterium]|jgi:serine/threonine protein kinase